MSLFQSGNQSAEETDMAAKCDFTLDDFRKQLDQLDKMGDMRSMIAGMPSLPK